MWVHERHRSSFFGLLDRFVVDLTGETEQPVAIELYGHGFNCPLLSTDFSGTSRTGGVRRNSKSGGVLLAHRIALRAQVSKALIEVHLRHFRSARRI
jgi:hypothetical protein